MSFSGWIMLFALWLGGGASALAAETPAVGAATPEDCRVGAMVREVQAALAAPAAPASLTIIAEHGTDSRYYTMIRGWLALELAGVESRLSATRGVDRAALEEEAAFLRRAIRRIDLE